MTGTPRFIVWAALPAQSCPTVATRLRDALGPVEVRPWQECDETGGVLVLAPHEYAEGERDRIVHAHDWSWVHLSSAGVDFVDLATWPRRVLLTRSWRCYAAPLAEYAAHAVLSREWAGAAPWDQADPRSNGTRHDAPVPELPVGARRGLVGARVGVAGWGPVGRGIAAVFGALGAHVVVLRRSGPDASTEGVEVVTDPLGIVDVDHLIIALPLTASTDRLFDRNVLDHCRPGIHVVNVSRPRLLDQDALVRLCATGRAFATLDVTEPEPLPPGHPLTTLPSVRISPHIAWQSGTSGSGFLDDLAFLARALIEGEPLPPAAVAGGDPDRAGVRIRTLRPREAR